MDGSGKTTQIDLLKDRLQSQGEACYLTAEPTELPTGKFCRSVLQKEVRVDQRTAAALFAADRIEHIHHPEEGLLAKLAGGYHVISSRYYFSSIAYQGDEADPAWIASLNLYAKRTLPADLTIFLDLDPAVSIERLGKRGDEPELYETREKLTQVRAAFHEAFEYFGQGERIVIVNASGNPQDVADQIWAAVEETVSLFQD